MKHAENLNVSIGDDEVGDAVVPVQEDAYLSVFDALISIANPRKCFKNQGAVNETVNKTKGRSGTINGDEVMNLGEPPESILLLPFLNLAADLFRGEDPPSVRVRQTSLNHSCKSDFFYNLLVRGIFGLPLDYVCDHFLGRGHATRIIDGPCFVKCSASTPGCPELAVQHCHLCELYVA